MCKEQIEEIDKLQVKIARAKEMNLFLQKSIRRTKKTKSKILEEVSLFIIPQLNSQNFVTYRPTPCVCNLTQRKA